ncbi:hypothetical protein GX411_06110 [Candidatus Fermentibacteria bacterium]|nr:hypothetical protein [Candidatus Fermentibacteria bacterium]
MSWKVLARGDNPDRQALSTLEELTGLGRGEVLLALRRSGLVAADGVSEERARSLAASLAGFGLECSAVPAESDDSDALSARFRVVLTGFRPGQRARLRERLQRMSGLPPEQVVLWLARIPFVLRDDVDHETARRIRKSLVDAGGFVELRPLRIPLQSGAQRHPPSADAAPGGFPPPLARYAPVPPTDGCGSPEASTPSAEASAEEAEAPPVLESVEPPLPDRSKWSRLPPPVLRFFAPGTTPALPPVLPKADESGRMPPVTAVRPPRFATPPPAPEPRYSIRVGRPSEEGLKALSSALSRELELREEEIARLSRRFPAWVATFSSPEKRHEIACRLEEMSVTVLVDPPGPAPEGLEGPGESRRGLLSWLGADG